MRDRYFIKIPASSSAGVKGEYIQIDPELLHLGILTEVYVKDPQTKQYKRALGIDNVVQTNIDPTELLDSWIMFREMIAPVLAKSGPAAKFSDDIHVVLDSLRVLISQLAAGEIESAKQALNEIGYSLLASSAYATTSLNNLEAQVIEQGGLAEVMTSIVVDRDDEGLYQSAAKSLAASLDDGLDAYMHLDTIDKKLDEIMKRIENSSRGWANSDTSQNWFQDQFNWFDDNESGFITQASRYLISPDTDSKKVIVNLIGQAKHRLQAITNRFNAMLADFQMVKRFILEELELTNNVDKYILTIRQSRDELAKAGHGNLTRFAVANGDIKTSDLDYWDEMIVDPDWSSLLSVKTRLQDKVEVIRQLLDQPPRLNYQTTLDQAQSYIERVEAVLSEYVVETVEHKTPSPELESSSVVEITLTPMHQDQSRIDELYEMMQGVAAVKFCGPQHLIGSSPRVMLNILFRMGKISEEDSIQHCEALKARMEADSLLVVDGKKRLEAWRTADPSVYRWIMFLQGRGRTGKKFKAWRLIEQALGDGVRLYQKYDLDPDQIVTVYDERKSEWAKSRIPT